MAGTPTFRIDRSESDPRYTLAPAGELDSGTYPELVDAFEEAVGALQGRELHLDLGALTFIDSAGLRAIIQLERAARERGVALVATQPAEPLTELFELSGVAERLTLDPQQGPAPAFRPFVERVEVDLESEVTAPAQARREIRQVAAGLLDETGLDAATLLASELVTNAVIHPPPSERASVRLRVTCYDDGIRCEVSDCGPGFDPARLGRRRPETGGRGLLLVDGLSSRWGTNRWSDEGEDRFCVWFELDRAAASATDAARAAG